MDLKRMICLAGMSGMMLPVVLVASVRAADDVGSASPPKAAPAASLASEQKQIAERFDRLKEKLLRMAELTAATDPRRASLLRKAVAQANDRGIDVELTQLADLLGQEQLASAVKAQGTVQQDLNKMLELLLSEDRSKRLQSEKERIREYIKRVNKIIKAQKELQGEAAGDGDPKHLGDEQEKLAGKTGELARDIQKNEGKPGTPTGDKADGDKQNQGESTPGEGKSQDKDKTKGKGKDADKRGEKKDPSGKGQPGKDPSGKEKSGQPADGDEQDSDAQGEGGKGGKGKEQEKDKNKDPAKDKDSQSGKDSEKGKDPSQDKDKDSDGDKAAGKGQGEGEGEGKPDDKQSKAAEGQGKGQGQGQGQGQGEGDQEEQSEEQPQQDENPVQKHIQQAEQRMRDAQRKLEEAQRHDAVEKQEQAKRELELAKAELEAILRQLREEEVARMLAMLEGRFRKMLEAQIEVYEGTKRVDRVPEQDRDRDHEIESGRLSRKEGGIVAEADKALVVLREEGSAVAFPEAVSDMRDDMEQVVVRLAQAKVNEITQGIEEDIIVALEELIAALQKAQKDLEKKSGNPMQGPSGQPGEPPLVDPIAEIKMIRSMQLWVNKRTKRYAELTKTEQAEQPELLTALKRLGEREQRIHRITRDIVVGRNE